MSCSEAFQGMEVLKLLELVLHVRVQHPHIVPSPPPPSHPIIVEKISRIRIKLITIKIQLYEIMIHSALIIRLKSKTY